MELLLHLLVAVPDSQQYQHQVTSLVVLETVGHGVQVKQANSWFRKSIPMGLIHVRN